MPRQLAPKVDEIEKDNSQLVDRWETESSIERRCGQWRGSVAGGSQPTPSNGQQTEN
jgi:hypothetical protein